MRPARATRGAIFSAVAVLTLATAWVAVAGGAAPVSAVVRQLDGSIRDLPGTVSPVDLANAIVAPVATPYRSPDTRPTPLWALAGLAAAIAALGGLRRLRNVPVPTQRLARVRSGVSGRAPTPRISRVTSRRTRGGLRVSWPRPTGPAPT